MLKILVCVKQVPDVNLVKIDPVTGSLIRSEEHTSELQSR